MFKVTNMMEDYVSDILEDYWEKLPLGCDCMTCKTDVLALTLNALPTRYVANEKGRMYVKVRFMDEQNHADVLRELTRAAIIVASKPSHHGPTHETTMA